MSTEFSGSGDLLGAPGQPRHIDEETGAALSDSQTGTLSGLQPSSFQVELGSTDDSILPTNPLFPDGVPGLNDDMPPTLDPSVIEVDPSQGEWYPGTGPGVYTFPLPSSSELQGEQQVSSTFLNDCPPDQGRIKVICDSGVLTRVSIYNGSNQTPVYTIENVGTGRSAPPSKSYCGDFTRVEVEHPKNHATFRIETNRTLDSQPS